MFWLGGTHITTSSILLLGRHNPFCLHYRPLSRIMNTISMLVYCLSLSGLLLFVCWPPLSPVPVLHYFGICKRQFMTSFSASFPVCCSCLLVFSLSTSGSSLLILHHFLNVDLWLCSWHLFRFVVACCCLLAFSLSGGSSSFILNCSWTLSIYDFILGIFSG
jgi:hypothetical protein